MGEGFWAGVAVASAVATAIATGISTIAAVWWRRQDRQEADWVVYGERASRSDEASRHGDGPYLKLDAQLANAGDGVAFRVAAHGRNGCKARLEGAWQSGPHGMMAGRDVYPVVPVMAPGDEVHLRVDCEAPDGWDDSEVVLTWIRSPTWKKRRSRRELVMKLGDMAPLPRAPKPAAVDREGNAV